MVRRLNGRLAWLVACVAGLSLALAVPAAAQSTGMIKGVVKDAQGQPVDGAKVSIDMTEGVSRHFETKSNKKGEFIQIGLQGGPYKVTAEKDKLVSNTAEVRVSISRPAEANLVLGAGTRGGGIEGSRGEERRIEEDLRGRRHREPRRQSRRSDRQVHRVGGAQRELLRLLLQHRVLGVAEEGLRQGGSGVQEGDRDQAGLRRGLQRPGERLQRHAQVRSGRDGERQGDGVERRRGRRPAAAAETPTRCSTRASSCGTPGRSPRRRSSSKAPIAANPNHAESHYQLGMALVNEGNLAGATTEFETYLKLAPEGPNAATAKGILGSLKK